LCLADIKKHDLLEPFSEWFRNTKYCTENLMAEGWRYSTWVRCKKII